MKNVCSVETERCVRVSRGVFFTFSESQSKWWWWWCVDTTMSQHTSAGISLTAPEGLLPLLDNPPARLQDGVWSAESLGTDGLMRVLTLYRPLAGLSEGLKTFCFDYKILQLKRNISAAYLIHRHLDIIQIQ